MNLDLTERVRKLEVKVAYLLRKVNTPEVKRILKPKAHSRYKAPTDQPDAIRDWMRRAVMKRDCDLHQGSVFVNDEGRRFVTFTRFVEKYMRTKAAFRDGQVILKTNVLRTMIRKVLDDMGLGVIDYPKRVGLTTLQAVVEIPAYGRHIGPDYFPTCMSLDERMGLNLTENASVDAPAHERQ